MCNLYRHTSNVDAIRELTGAMNRPNLPVFGDIYPNYEAPIVRNGSGGREIATLKWGVPLSLGDGKKPKPVTNVRNLTSPFWRSMLKDPTRRCLVPVTAFSEWTDTPDPVTGKKRLVWFGVKDTELFCFAGLWRPTEDGERFAFLTTEPNALVAPIHAKAMPVIVGPDDYTAWLTADYAAACALAKPYPAAAMAIVPAS